MIEQIKLAFSENRLAIIVATVILFASLVLGYFLEPYLHGYLSPVVEQLEEGVSNGTIKVTFNSIFLNNIRIVFLMFLTGFILCFSAIILVFNGLFVGYFVADYGNLVKSLLYLIPHGIFELSSIVIACASGFVAFNFLFKFLKTLSIQENNSVKDKLAISFNESSIKLEQAIILLMVASILMAVAGFVEAYLTIPIADYLLSILS